MILHVMKIRRVEMIYPMRGLTAIRTVAIPSVSILILVSITTALERAVFMVLATIQDCRSISNAMRSWVSHNRHL